MPVKSILVVAIIVVIGLFYLLDISASPSVDLGSEGTGRIHRKRSDTAEGIICAFSQRRLRPYGGGDSASLPRGARQRRGHFHG